MLIAKGIKQIRIVNFLSVGITCILWIILFSIFFGDDALRLSARMRSSYPVIVSSLLLLVFALLISLKTRPQKGTLLFALFLSLYSEDFVLQYLHNLNPAWVPQWLLMASFAVTGTVFMKTLQIFPRTLSSDDISTVIKWKIPAAYFRWSLKNYTWLVYPVIIFGAGYASTFYMPVVGFTVAFLNIGILITGTLNLFATYKRSTHTERNKILWLGWGVLIFSFLAILMIIIQLFNKEMSETLRLIFNSLMAASLVLSMAMSLFFSDTFDTGILIRRTLVDGTIFTIIIILYNTLEHYFLHWLSEVLHLSDVLISSFLSGIFVMIFSPLHHRLMHFLERKIKKQEAHHTQV
jgi:hypothetical protein